MNPSYRHRPTVRNLERAFAITTGATLALLVHPAAHPYALIAAAVALLISTLALAREWW